MSEFVVGQKLYALNDNSPGAYWKHEKVGKPWFTFESCVIVKVNPKTLKIRLRKATMISRGNWSRSYLIGLEEVGCIWHINKSGAMVRELEERLADLKEAKREVNERQEYVSRLKGMLNSQKKKNGEVAYE